MMQPEGTLSLNTIAKSLEKRGYNTGPNKLRELLCDLKIIKKVGKSHLPKKEFVEQGYLIKWQSSVYINFKGDEEPRYKPLVTQKGRPWIFGLITKELNKATEEKAA